MDNGYKCLKHRQRGVSLVELMVSLVIGLIVILGAGQLFLTVFNTRDQVATLGEKQAAVNFAVETLLRDIRRADWGGSNWNSDSGVLSLAVENRGDAGGDCDPGAVVDKEYRLNDDDVFVVNVTCNGDPSGYQELVGGFIPASNDCEDSGFCVNDEGWDDGVLRISFTLVATDPDDSESTPDPMEFFAVNRTKAIAGKSWGEGDNGDGDGPDPATTPDPDRPGYYLSGGEMYGPNCYNSKGYKGGCE